MSGKLLLIDGYSIINRAFYAIRELTNSEGLHTNGIYGFLNIFFSIFSREQPDHILVAFDVKQKTFRHEMYDQYKGNRKPMPAELTEQVPVLKDVLAAMKIKTVELPGYEADDILGTYSRIAQEKGMEVVILSGDRDLLQLATDTVMISLPRTKAGKTEYEEYYAKDVLEKYQVTPAEFIDLKALMGDASDNIPGIPGIGEKTATAIITQYKSLENAIEHAHEIKPKKASENLEAYAELGRLSKTLATINTQSPVSVSIEEGRIENENAFYNSDSFELFKKLELNRLLSRFDLTEVKPQADAEYELHNFSELDIHMAADVPVGLYFDKDLSIAALCRKGEKVQLYSGTDKDVISDLFRSGSQICVFGLKDMLHFLNMHDFSSDRIYDLEIMAYLINPLQSSYSYDMVSKDYLDTVVPSKQELLGKSEVRSALSDPELSKSVFQMAAFNAKTAIEAFDILKKKLEEFEMWDLFQTIEIPLIYSLYYMEKAGVQVERDRLRDFSAKLAEAASDLEKDIYAQAGEQFNINSPQQLGIILFEKLHLPASKKTKTGYSTSADILEKLAPDFPIVNKILSYRQITKLKSTYADGLVNYISEDSRIHGTFNQTITATGRISSTDPNLQNIPIRTELGQEVRRAFTAKDGCIFLDADYSQIELRLLAHMSGDANLIEAYNTEADIHRITASKVFHVPYEEVTKEQRRNAKAVNFGIVYGISSFGLSQDLSISRKQASDYIRQYFETYPGIKEYLDRTVRRAKIDGYVTSIFGRRRPIPELSSGNFQQRAFGERAAMNSPLQGSAADIMKIAMINVDRALRKKGLRSQIVLQIHDELLVETYEDEINEVKKILDFEMKHAAKLSVPLEIDIGEGKDWFVAH